MSRICVKCGRKGTRGFAVHKGRGASDDYVTVEEWMCANRIACEKRQHAIELHEAWCPDNCPVCGIALRKRPADNPSHD